MIVTVLLLELAFRNVESRAAEKEKKEKSNKKKDKEARDQWYPVIYDNLKLLDSKMHAELIKDISSRTGLDIDEVRIIRIDLVSGKTELEVHSRNLVS